MVKVKNIKLPTEGSEKLIYTESELKKKIYKMIENFESEVVEFK